ncbi:uncharacterized protein LOC111092485 isoform X1 [Canis lupus familiaris]|uniref:uncharacterized protein LOC125753680 n=1 Tax=Canis lupus dingo TaxID=286419 RepID=UPI0018F5C11D|nr:uncharacterized protein LOC111092485 isoform X1 [Canis lupus familiaris]XP_048957418.1 uncharacterized protein LOC125753680 [Canis lupus dingo]
MIDAQRSRVGGIRPVQRFRGKSWVRTSTGTAPTKHLDRFRVKRKIQLEFLPHVPLTFHNDFQKPDSQLETQTLWAGEGGGGGKPHKTKKRLRHHFRLARPANVQRWRKTHTPTATTSPKCAGAWRGPAPHALHRPPAPRSRREEARARRAGPAGTARGFRPEARRAPFGSGPSPAPARELSRRLNIRDQRLAPARISGEGHEEKDPVTPLSAPVVAQAAALGERVMKLELEKCIGLWPLCWKVLSPRTGKAVPILLLQNFTAEVLGQNPCLQNSGLSFTCIHVP